MDHTPDHKCPQCGYKWYEKPLVQIDTQKDLGSLVQDAKNLTNQALQHFTSSTLIATMNYYAENTPKN